jgi:hypothetical protein
LKTSAGNPRGLRDAPDRGGPAERAIRAGAQLGIDSDPVGTCTSASGMLRL